jgi:hypothetical protein
MKIKLARQAHAEMVRGVFRLFAGRKPTLKELEKFVASRASRDAVKAYIVANGLRKDGNGALENFTGPAGVHFHSYWELSGNGLCAAWRRQARALADSGIHVRLSGKGAWGKPDAQALAEVGHLTTTQVLPRVTIDCFPLGSEQAIATSIQRVTRPRQIVCTMMERDRIGPSAAAAANQVDWWLSCPANVEAFARSGVQVSRLKVIPVPFFPEDPAITLVGRQRNVGVPRYYHIGTLCTRKDQARLLLGFLRAFKPGQAQLRIKTAGVDAGYPDAERLRVLHLEDERVRNNGWNVNNMRAPHVEIVHAFWSEDQVIELHRWGDVYLSIAHGEGWDMPAFAAILAGNMLIYTPSGGPQSFAGEKDLLVRQTGWEVCNSFYSWERDARWITYDEEHYVEQLRVASDNLLPKEQHRDFTPFTAKSVGALMRSYVEPMLGA